MITSQSNNDDTTMHTITIHACAQAFDVPDSQVRQWIERGKLNSKIGLSGGSRVFVDAQYNRFKKLWFGVSSNEEAQHPKAVRGGWGS